MLHFSGHGLKSDSGELFFAASNTRPSRLGSTAVSADFVQRCMRDARSRSVVLLLDCCYGGAFAQGVTVRAGGDVNVLDSFPEGKSGGGRGRAVITASNAMEYAFEGDQLADDQHRRPSVFTSALVEGMATGDADRDEDGLISLNELYDYVFDKVRERNPHQTPSRQFELEGELYLARSRRRRIRPAPIPPDLQAAIADPNMYARRGAVHELGSRLASEDLAVAAGAYETLTELARTDIEYIADLAATTLGQVAVRPEETELHFGEQQQGSQPPHRMVRLPGPPIARACAPRASHDWIRVNETTGGLDVSVDTTGTGVMRGSIDLKGPTGTAEIAVDIKLLPQAVRTSLADRLSRPADQETVAPAMPADQPEEGAAAESDREAEQAATWRAGEQGGQDATKAAYTEATEPHRDHAPTATETSDVPTPAGASTARPSIRKGAAFADRRLLFAGSLAAVGAVLAVAGLFPMYMSGSPFNPFPYHFSIWSTSSGWSSFLVITAALYLTAGVCTLIPRPGPLFGPGLLLATAAASTSALAYNVSFRFIIFPPYSYHTRYAVGFWLQVASNLSLIAAACAAGLALARASEVRLVQRPPRNALPLVITLLGLAGALALVILDLKLPSLKEFGVGWRSVEVASISATVWALVMPAWAAAVVPRRLGVALLAGWIWVGAAFFVYCYVFLGSVHAGRGPIIAFGLTLLALSAVAVPFARAASGAMPRVT